MAYPATRMRRLRQTPVLRDMVQENTLSMDDLIYPIFIEEEVDAPAPISSLPGIMRHPEKDIAKVVKEAEELGIRAIILFGVSHHKDTSGSDSFKKDGLLARMIEKSKDAAPDMCIIADNCFCEYTDHGHCGIPSDDGVDNDRTLENLVKQSLVCVEAGADMLAPSGMMDGTIAAMREGLEEHNYGNMPIMAYASKMASSFYGPFRAAAGCELKGDRKQYQMNPANGREAIREALLDEAEGADILMVKPGMPYLDVLRDLRDYTQLPLAAYQVSGEYAMIKFAAEAGALDEEKVMMESLLAFKRAGASLILSYFAPQVAKLLREK
ncbi:MAG: porphobilinogen synthase [Alphaproteobacteria bacterium]|nr:porphobilinogen synthase [Alphaproteobacteria bacterium]MDD9920379.1 porphobilinogen synthase [Alphaproteobacteria bacterium]